MVNVKILEGPLVVLLFEVFSWVEGCDQELSEFYFPAAVQVDDPHESLELLLLEVHLLEYHVFELVL